MSIQTDKHLAGLSSAESLLVAAGRDRRPGSPPNIPPVLAQNFVLGTDRVHARDNSTPTWEALQEIVGLLEEGESIAFASGMAGIAAVFDQLHAGSRVVLPDDCYLAARSDLLWLKSLSNPMLVVADLRAICAASRKPTALQARTFPFNPRPSSLVVTPTYSLGSFP